MTVLHAVKALGTSLHNKLFTRYKHPLTKSEHGQYKKMRNQYIRSAIIEVLAENGL